VLDEYDYEYLADVGHEYEETSLKKSEQNHCLDEKELLFREVRIKIWMGISLAILLTLLTMFNTKHMLVNILVLLVILGEAVVTVYYSKEEFQRNNDLEAVNAAQQLTEEIRVLNR